MKLINAISPRNIHYTCNDISWQQCSISIPLNSDYSVGHFCPSMNAWDVFQSSEIKFMEDANHNNSKFAYFFKILSNSIKSELISIISHKATSFVISSHQQNNAFTSCLCQLHSISHYLDIIIGQYNYTNMTQKIGREGQ